MKPIEINNENFELTIKSEQTTLVDMWAPWCGPCRMLSPIIDEIAEEAEELGIKVAKVNVDEHPEIAKQFSVTAIPTLLFFKNGELINKSIGFVQKDEILALLK